MSVTVTRPQINTSVCMWQVCNMCNRDQLSELRKTRLFIANQADPGLPGSIVLLVRAGASCAQPEFCDLGASGIGGVLAWHENTPAAACWNTPHDHMHARSRGIADTHQVELPAVGRGESACVESLRRTVRRIGRQFERGDEYFRIRLVQCRIR